MSSISISIYPVCIHVHVIELNAMFILSTLSEQKNPGMICTSVPIFLETLCGYIWQEKQLHNRMSRDRYRHLYHFSNKFVPDIIHKFKSFNLGESIR